jgi:hypothetical protein
LYRIIHHMPKQPKQSHGKVTGKCIFCGGGSLSKEHFWPAWSVKLFPPGSHAEHYEVLVTRTEIDTLARPVEVQSRQGSTTTKKIRVVCQKCNNEWMGDIETAAKPILSRVILGRADVLDQAAQKVLAVWIALKVMVGEQNRPKDAVVTQEQRDEFKENRTIPEGMRIWIANYKGETWRFRYRRHNATLTLPNPKVMPVGGKNVQTTTFGFGNLLVHTMTYSRQGVDINQFVKVGSQMTILWPSAAPTISWPEPFVLLDKGANQLAAQIELLYRSPKVLRRPSPE